MNKLNAYTRNSRNCKSSYKKGPKSPEKKNSEKEISRKNNQMIKNKRTCL